MSTPNFIKTTKDEIQFNTAVNNKTDDSLVIAHGENNGNGTASIMMYRGTNNNSNYILKIDGKNDETFDVCGGIATNASITFKDDIQNTVITSLDGQYDSSGYNVLQINTAGVEKRTLKTSCNTLIEFTSNNQQIKIGVTCDTHITVKNTGNYSGCELLIPYEGISNIAGKVFIWYSNSSSPSNSIDVKTYDNSGNTGTTEEYKLLPVRSGDIRPSVNSLTVAANTFQEFLPMVSDVNSTDVKWIYIENI